MFALAQLAVPDWYLFVVAFSFGTIIGSFLNVYIYRFHTGKSLSGHSHCLSCATLLQWFELIPLLSYLGLRGRCRTCGCKIPVRYFLVELLTATVFTLSVTIATFLTELLILWCIMGVLVVITVYDYYHYIIPDSLTVFLSGAVACLWGVWLYFGFESVDSLLWALGATIGGATFFFFLWLISQGQWLGFGDVKLALPLGFLVGSQLVFSFVVLSFWIGAAVSLVIVGYLSLRNRGQAGLHLPSTRLTMKSAVPFAPFMVASSLVILFTHFNVLHLFSFV